MLSHSDFIIFYSGQRFAILGQLEFDISKLKKYYRIPIIGTYFVSSVRRLLFYDVPLLNFHSAELHSDTAVALNCYNMITAIQGNSCKNPDQQVSYDRASYVPRRPCLF